MCFQLSDEWADSQMDVDGGKGCLGSLVMLKRQHPHLKVVLSIGGGSASANFAPVAASAAARDKFGRSARGLVETSGLDGIDSEFLCHLTSYKDSKTVRHVTVCAMIYGSLTDN